MKSWTVPKFSAASPRSAAELAAPLALADPPAFDASPFVKHSALVPVTTPFTPEPVTPFKFTGVPELLYVVKVALTPPKAVLLENVVPGPLVRGKNNMFWSAACPTVPANRQPAKTAIKARIEKDLFVRLSLDGTV
jgi:hypothetical protein